MPIEPDVSLRLGSGMMQTTRFLALLGLVLGTAGLARATVLLNDTFADGDRTTQNLPTSAAFYQGGSSANQSLDVVSQTLQYSFDATSGQLGQYVVYFTAAGSPVSLNVGDKLSVSLAFSGDQIVNGADSLRLGLFNSGESRVSADYSGVANAAFNACTGYSFFGNMGAGSNTGTLRQRTGTNNTLWNSTANANLRSSLAPLAYDANTMYTLSLELSYISSGTMQVTFSDSKGTSYSVNDTVSPFTTFDTFSLFIGNGTLTDVTFAMDNVTVTYTPVPEPTSAALLVAIPLVAMVLRNRSRRI